MDDILGLVTAVSGSEMRAAVTAEKFTEASIRLGTMIKVQSADLEVVGTISAAEVEAHGSPARIVLVVDLLGEIVPSAERPAQFRQGVSRHPIPGAPVRATTTADLTAVYAQSSVSTIGIGSLYHDPTRPACVLIDELLAKNFAVLGATGSGKSCAVYLAAVRHSRRSPKRAHHCARSP